MSYVNTVRSSNAMTSPPPLSIIIPCLDEADNIRSAINDALKELDDGNISNANIGDLIVFRNVGAYSIVFNMPFHCQTKPSILLRKRDQSIHIIREEENIEDLFNSEGGNLISQQ